MAMSVGVLDHYNVSTRKLKETVRFYEDVLGFKNGPRPPFNFPGAWLYSADHPVLHINDISQTDKEQRPDSGVRIKLHNNQLHFQGLPLRLQVDHGQHGKRGRERWLGNMDLEPAKKCHPGLPVRRSISRNQGLWAHRAR